jgi:hypothetical protein
MLSAFNRCSCTARPASGPTSPSGKCRAPTTATPCVLRCVCRCRLRRGSSSRPFVEQGFVCGPRSASPRPAPCGNVRCVGVPPTTSRDPAAPAVRVTDCVGARVGACVCVCAACTAPLAAAGLDACPWAATAPAAPMSRRARWSWRVLRHKTTATRLCTALGTDARTRAPRRCSATRRR